MSDCDCKNTTLGFNNMIIRNTRFLDAVWPAQDAAAKALRFVIIMLAGTALIALSAKIQVPTQPVPTTLQVLAILAIAGLTGSRLGTSIVALYLFMGAMGLPYFAKPDAGFGLVYFAGPTGGYLIGFLVAAFLAGLPADLGQSKNPLLTIPAMAVGALIILGLGTLWLAANPTFNLTTEKAFAVGFMPFLVLDLVKAVLAALLVAGLWKVFAGKQG